MKITFPIIALLLFPCARAGLKTISFEAEITNMPDSIAGLKVGDTITGKCTYDAGVKDVNPLDPNIGDYVFNDPACRLVFNLNGYRLQSRPGSSFQIQIINNYSGYDGYTVGSLNNVFTGKDFLPDSMSVNLWDPTAKALDSDQLPAKAPVLKRIDNQSYVSVFGKHGDLLPNFYADVRKVADGDRLFVPLVEILPASGDFVTGQSIIPVIRIEAEDTSGIRLEKILLDDVDVTKRYLTASRRGKLPEDHPGVVWQLLPPKPSPGKHVFKVMARLADGRKVWGQADWNILQARMKKPVSPSRTETKPNSNSATRPN